MIRRTARAALSVLAALVVAACASPAPKPAPTPTAPAATATPPAEPPPPTETETENAHATAPAPAPQEAPPPAIRLPSGIEVDRAAGEVRVPAFVACREGFLEQIACLAGTREHESLLVTETKPSDVHAALLLLGLEPGAPGSWTLDGDAVKVTPPRGPRVELAIAFEAGGTRREVPLASWVRGADGRAFAGSWVFSGSRFAKNPKSWGEGEHYVADFSGSLAGLVTFGDETLAATTVIPDQIDVEAANWQSWTERMPAEGTPATFIIRRAAPSAAP